MRTKKIDMKEISPDKLKEILDAHKDWLASGGKEGERADLSGARLRGVNNLLSKADLRRANLCNANLRGVNLRSANLSESVLSGVNFNNADLCGVDLCGADLSKADLIVANLNGAKLSGINLRRANLSGAKLSGADLSEANLRGANLRGAKLRGAKLIRTDLSNANLSGARFRDAKLRETKLSGANLHRAKLNGTDLSGADLSGVNLSLAYLNKTNLIDAILKYSILVSADLENAYLTNADISGANIFHIKTHGWMIEGIKCTHVYNCPYYASEEDREKSRINFKEGEFEAKYKVIPTIELLLNGKLTLADMRKMSYIISEANRKYEADLELSSIENSFRGIEVRFKANSEKNLEAIAYMIVREYKNRDLDSKLLEIMKKEKILSAGIEKQEIVHTHIHHFEESKKFSELQSAIINYKGTIVIGDVKGTTLALGQGATATTLINNYTNNKEEIDKTLKEFKKEVSGEVQQQVEALAGALREKNGEEASGIWGKIKKAKEAVTKADEILKTGEKVVKWSKRAIDLYNKLEGWL